MARFNKSYVTGTVALVGAGVVGAGLGLLFAPHSGRKTRKEIVRFAKSVGTHTDKAVHELADEFAEFADAMGHKASALLDEGGEMTRRSKEKLLAAFETGQVRLERQRTRLQDLMS